MEPLHPSDPPRVGSYRLTARLGAGGMGQVYLARTASGRQVVVKVIRSEHTGDQEFRARFAREAEAARRVGGFHTAQVVDADPDADPPWIATAHIPGPTLDRAVRAHGPIAPPALYVLATGLAEGLRAVHACGLVHRDLKPGNIILAHDGPRIIDFGIARPLDGNSMTTQGAVFGTLPYMSPEQTDGSRVDPPSDMFSLGTVLAYAATGTNPFAGGTMAETLRRIISPAPDPGDVVEDVRALIATCWNHDPARRPTPEQILRRFEELDLHGAWPPPHLTGIDQPDPASGHPSRPPVSGPQPGYRPPAGTAATPTPPRYRPPAPHPAPVPAPYPPPVPVAQPAATGRPVGRWVIGFVAVALVGIVITAVSLWLLPEADTGDAPAGGVTADGRLDASDPLVIAEDIGAVLAVAFDPGGGTLATGNEDGSAQLWDAETGEALTVFEGHGVTVNSVAFSPDGTTLATGGNDNTVRLWDTATGEEIRTFDGHEDWVRSVAFSPDGTMIATGSDDQSVRLWDTATGDETAVMTGHENFVTTVAFSPDGTTLATGSDDRTVRLWDTATDDETAVMTGHGSFLRSVVFSPDGTMIATGSDDGTARLWNAETGEALTTLDGHENSVTAVAFSPDGATLATAGIDGTVRLWNLD